MSIWLLELSLKILQLLYPLVTDTHIWTHDNMSGGLFGVLAALALTQFSFLLLEHVPPYCTPTTGLNEKNNNNDTGWVTILLFICHHTGLRDSEKDWSNYVISTGLLAYTMYATSLDPQAYATIPWVWGWLNVFYSTSACIYGHWERYVNLRGINMIWTVWQIEMVKYW